MHPFKTGFNFLWLHSEQYNENKKKNLAMSVIILKIDVFIAVFHHSISHMCTGGVLVGPVHCFDTAAMSGLALIMGVIITDFKLIHYYNNNIIIKQLCEGIIIIMSCNNCNYVIIVTM